MLDTLKKGERIVARLAEYAKSKGLVFNEGSNGLSDSSPYCMLKGGSSLSYRKQSRKWPEEGIVIFASDVDADNLHKELGLKIYDNS